MKLWKKGLALALSAGMVATSFAGTALAAEDREKISKIYLTVDSSIGVGDDDSDVSVTTDESSYTVDEVEVTNDDGEWSAGDKPKIRVTLEADDDYYFSTTSSSAFKFTGNADVDSVSASRKNSNSTMTVTITLDALEGDLEIESVAWENDNSPVATWEEDEGSGAKSYQVRLYRGSSSVTEAFSTTNTEYNFSSYITKTGEYSFKVRSMGNDSKKGEWVESDTMYVDDDQLARIKSGYYGTSNTSSGSASGGPAGNNGTGSWLKDNVGWWFRNADGSYTVNGWQYINNKWYCFDYVGYMRTGWIPSNGTWYYCDQTSGAMLTNATTPDGYRVDANGVWVP